MIIKLQQITEHKRQRTTRQQDLDRERARELKTAVSAWDRFLEDWKKLTAQAMRGRRYDNSRV